MMVTPRCPNPHGSPAATGGSFLQPTVSTGLRPSVSLQEARWVLTDSLLPAGAAHFGLPQGQVASLPLLPSEPVPPQGKERCPTCSLRVQPCLSASGPRCQDSPGDHWVQIPRLPLATSGLGPGSRFTGGVSVPSLFTDCRPASLLAAPPQPASPSPALPLFTWGRDPASTPDRDFLGARSFVLGKPR